MFADTKAYADLGEKIVDLLKSPLNDKNISTEEGSNTRERNERAQAGAAARSPYYGFFFTSISSIGTIWSLAVLQAILSSWLICLCVNIFFPRSSLASIIIISCLSIASTLPIFSALMMPDIFTSSGTIATLMIIFFARRLGSVGLLLTILTSLAAILFHSTHTLILLSISLIAISLKKWIEGSYETKYFLFIPLAIFVLSVGSQQIYSDIAHRMVGGSIYRPPFLTARLLEDGPGRLALTSVCSEDADFAICKFAGKDLTDSQAFLWERETSKSVFADASSEVRLSLAKQDVAFAVKVFRHEPIAVINTSLKNIWILFVQSRLDDVGDGSAVYRDPFFRSLSKYDSFSSQCRIDPSACAPKLDLITAGLIFAWVSYLSLAYVLYSIFKNGLRHQIHQFAFCLVGAVFINDIICAVLSGPYPRYHTRMSFLFLFAALLCAFYEHSTKFKKNNS